MAKRIILAVSLLFVISTSLGQSFDSISIESICNGRNLVDNGKIKGEIIINNHLSNKDSKPMNNI